MAFHSDKKTDTNANGQAAGQEPEVTRERGERSERGNRRERDRAERTEPKEEATSFVGSARNGRFRTIGEAGRADMFMKAYTEAMKDEGEQVSRLIKPTGEHLRDMSRKYGFLIYLTPVEADVMFHVLLLEPTKEPVRREQLRDKQRRDTDVYIYTATIDCVTEDIIAKIRAFMSANVKCAGKHFYTGVSILPAEVDVTDENAITPYIISADDANWSAAGCDKPFTPDYLRDGSSLRGTLSFQPGAVETNFGRQPVRADLAGVIREHVEGQSKNLLLEGDVGQTYSQYYGFINGRYVGPEESRNRRRDEIDYRHYQAECILTEINTFCDAEVGGLERFLLTIGNVPFINTNDRWMQQFEGNFDKDGLTDLGGYGYGFDPAVVEPNRLEGAEDYANDPRKFPDFMSKIFYTDDGMDFAYLLAEGAPGWTNAKLLLDAYEGDRDAQATIDAALDNVTDNYWSEDTADWKKEDRQLVIDAIRMPTGYYIDKSGDRQPIEKYDMLAVLNRLKDKNPELIDDFIECNTLGGSRYNYEERISRLVDIYMKVTQGTFVMKGYVTKLYFNPKALEALYTCIKESDFCLSMEYEGGSDYSRRSRNGGERYSLRNNLAARTRTTYAAGRRDEGRTARATYRRN